MLCGELDLLLCIASLMYCTAMLQKHPLPRHQHIPSLIGPTSALYPTVL